jgi:hypothetical protein
VADDGHLGAVHPERDALAGEFIADVQLPARQADQAGAVDHPLDLDRGAGPAGQRRGSGGAAPVSGQAGQRGDVEPGGQRLEPGAVEVTLSYSGDIPETVLFDLADSTVERNFETLEKFIGRLDAIQRSTADSGSRVWKDVPATEIVDGFLAEYQADRKAQRVRPDYIAEYIRRCEQVGELGNWTVRLVSSKSGDLAPIGSYEIGLIRREPLNNPAQEGRYTIRRVVSPLDESRDLDRDQKGRALAATRKAAEGKLDKKTGQPRNPGVPTGTPLRRERRPDQALLLIYPLKNPLAASGQVILPLVAFAISFPFSKHSAKTEYVVNEIWQKQTLDGIDDDDEAGL